MLRTLVRDAVIAFAAALVAPAALAGHATQTLVVSATVSPGAVVGFEVSVQPLVITDADLKRGYVDVVMKSRMQLKTVRGGDALPPLMLDMEPRADLFRSITVGAPPTEHATVAPAMNEAADGNGAHIAEFRYRFELTDAARLGGYDTAISLAIDL